MLLPKSTKLLALLFAISLRFGTAQAQSTSHLQKTVHSKLEAVTTRLLHKMAIDLDRLVQERVGNSPQHYNLDPGDSLSESPVPREDRKRRASS